MALCGSEYIRTNSSCFQVLVYIQRSKEVSTFVNTVVCSVTNNVTAETHSLHYKVTDYYSIAFTGINNGLGIFMLNENNVFYACSH